MELGAQGGAQECPQSPNYRKYCLEYPKYTLIGVIAEDRGAAVVLELAPSCKVGAEEVRAWRALPM